MIIGRICEGEIKLHLLVSTNTLLYIRFDFNLFLCFFTFSASDPLPTIKALLRSLQPASTAESWRCVHRGALLGVLKEIHVKAVPFPISSPGGKEENKAPLPVSTCTKAGAIQLASQGSGAGRLRQPNKSSRSGAGGTWSAAAELPALPGPSTRPCLRGMENWKRDLFVKSLRSRSPLSPPSPGESGDCLVLVVM